MYPEYFAQGIPKIDAEIAKNSRFWMETLYRFSSVVYSR